MSEHYTYLLVDFFCIVFPFIFSFVPRFDFISQWRYFYLPCLLTGLFFVLWDILFTWLGVWSFNPKYVVGLYLFGLPLEEYLFFICIPYACTFTYHCLTRYFTFSVAARGKVFKWLLVAALVAVAFVNLPRLYTSVTFILLALFLSFLSLKKVAYLPAFFFCFMLILVPFFLSNGVLTGSFIGRTVVMYNNDHNLGIRMLTIPVEDTFYGMLLLLMNVAGYEYLKDKAKNKHYQPVTVGE
jgi:lycopene cyclase domain-containing protein